MALRLGKLCGNGPDVWLTLQRRYDLKAAAAEVDVSKIPTLRAAG
jgi:plasmid maintenance system antidote protein VapI